MALLGLVHGVSHLQAERIVLDGMEQEIAGPLIAYGLDANSSYQKIEANGVNPSASPFFSPVFGKSQIFGYLNDNSATASPYLYKQLPNATPQDSYSIEFDLRPDWGNSGEWDFILGSQSSFGAHFKMVGSSFQVNGRSSAGGALGWIPIPNIVVVPYQDDCLRSWIWGEQSLLSNFDYERIRSCGDYSHRFL
jgi:hypothetical protein